MSSGTIDGTRAVDATIPDAITGGAHDPAYRPDIQGLRGLAVLLVVLFHVGLVRGGFVGVDIFFVISGFVITGSLRRRGASRPSEFVDFYSRRVKRLVPASAAMISTVALASIVLVGAGEIQDQTLGALLAAVFSVSNIFFIGESAGYFSTSVDLNPMLHTWSLGVEEQFYLLFPLVFGAASVLLRPRRFRLVAIALAGLILASLGLSVFSSYGGPPGVDAETSLRFAFFSAPTRAWQFLAGVAVYAVAESGRHRARPLLPLLGLGLVTIAAVIISSDSAYPGWWAFLPTVGAAFVIHGARGSAVVRPLLDARPLRFLGDISYGWYLWHWPLIVFARSNVSASTSVLCLAAVAALIPAVLSRRTLEQHNWSARSILLVAVPCSLAALACFWLARPSVNDAIDSDLGALTAFEECVFGNTALEEGSCESRVSEPIGDLLLIGDSHAWAASDGVVAAANALGFDVTARWRPACPFVAELPFEHQWSGVCGFYRDEIQNFVEPGSFDIVVIVNNSTVYLDERVRLDEPSPVRDSEVTARAASWPAAVDGVIRDVLQKGSVPLLITGVPPAAEDAGTVSLLSHWNLDDRFPPAETAVWPAVIDSEIEVVASIEGAYALDLRSVFCDRNGCLRRAGGHYVYRDDDHLSAHGSRLMAPALERALVAILAEEASS